MSVLRKTVLSFYCSTGCKAPRHRHDANSKDIGVYLPERRAICSPDVFFISRVRDKASRKRVGADGLFVIAIPSIGSRHGSVRRRRSKSSKHAETLRRERQAEVL